jgi:hypothetical protein
MFLIHDTKAASVFDTLAASFLFMANYGQHALN